MSETEDFDGEISGVDTNPQGARLRDQVRAYMAAQTMSWTSVALQTGVGKSTLQAWRTGKYRGDNDAINDKMRLWLDSETMLQRVKVSLPDVPFVQTRTAAKFLAVLQYAQSMPAIGVISGGAGVGKTTAVKQHKLAHPNVWHLTAMPLLSSAYAIMEYLREALGVPQTAPFKLGHAICNKVAGTRGLIVIDEAQHLDTKAFDQLRSVFDAAAVGMVFVGNEDMWGRLDGGGREQRFAQIFSRVGKRVTVNRPSTADVEAILDAAGIEETPHRNLLKAIAGKPGALRTMASTLRDARIVANGAGQALAATHIDMTYRSNTGELEAV